VASAYLLAVLVVGHLYMALINPSTRPALSGIVSGTVEGSWSRTHHPRGADPEAM
jgi:cytochrome b subunit of formate dehydrogenase